MKQYSISVVIVLILTLANILVYLFNINPTLMLIILASSAAFYKAFTSEKFSDIYNVYSFKCTLNINNLLELIASFLVGLIACKNIYDFNILDLVFFIILSLLVYRFLFFNLSKKFYKGI